MRTTFAAALVGTLVGFSCSGLLTSQSNAYPCDFLQPPELRDAPCVTGDVCSVNNVCVRFVYEGPRFEGPATLPDFSVTAGGGTLVHPLQLQSAPASVLQSSPGAGSVLAQSPESMRVINADGVVNPGFDASIGRVLGVHTLGPLARANFSVIKGPPRGLTGPNVPPVVLQLIMKDRSIVDVTTSGPPPRVVPGVVRILRDGRVAATRETTGELLITPVVTGLESNVIATAIDGTDGIIDFVPNVGKLSEFWPVLALHRDGIHALGRDPSSDAGVAFPKISPDLAANLFYPPGSHMKLNASGDLLTVVADVPVVGTVLSTWKINNAGLQPSATRAWDDCKVTNLRSFNPVMSGITASVEVLRASSTTPAFGARVIGSSGQAMFDECTMEELPLQFPVLEISRASNDGDVVDDTSTAVPGVVLAGKHGQLWKGDSFAEALPLYLDRVPFDVSVIAVERGGVTTSLMTALTDKYLSAQEFAGEAANGFRRLNLSTGTSAHMSGLVHQSRDWVVTSQSDLLRLPAKVFGDTDDAGMPVEGDPPAYGPRLLNGRSEPVSKMLWGEAVATPDGGLSLVVAADDSVYFVREINAPGATSELPNQLPPQFPVLTPEPGVFIRHLAVERSALGTDGLTHLRGFVVTSRNAYQIELSGTPARWKASPLVLQAGEPVEVWYDNPRGGLGRIGYRDGSIYTLPGGYQLAAPLPSVAGAQAPRVVDYENLGGWPVAFTSIGVYAAWWDTLPNGKLDNKFEDGRQKPMQWRAVTLPDGGTPWVKPGDSTPTGRLYVKEEEYACFPTDGGVEVECSRAEVQKLTRAFRLFLFQDNYVLELGRHVRNNKTPPLEF